MADLEILARAFARLVAEEMRALEHKPDYTQDAPPEGMSKRTYLDHCARGDWPSVKRGRLRVSKRADVDAYFAARPAPAKRRKARESDDEFFARISRPVR